MRTTVTLDPDVETLVRKAMREKDLSFKAVLNAAIRAGLARPASPSRRYRLRTYRMGRRPALQLDRALALASAMEDEELLRKLSVRK